MLEDTKTRHFVTDQSINLVIKRVHTKKQVPHRRTGKKMSFSVTVVNLEGQTRKFLVSTGTTVSQLCQAITQSGYTRLGHLMFNSKLLSATSTMAELDVKANSLIEMAPLPGSLLFLPKWPVTPEKGRPVVLLRYFGRSEALVMSITSTEVGPTHSLYPYYFTIIEPPTNNTGEHEVRSTIKLPYTPSFLQGHQFCTVPIGGWTWIQEQRNAQQPAFDVDEIVQKVIKGVDFHKLFIYPKRPVEYLLT